MNFEEMDEILEEAYEKKLAVFIHGKPGIGKSENLRKFVEKHDLQLIDLRLSQLDAVDLRGLPKIGINGEGEETKWITPDFFPKSGKGIMFLDEFNNANPSIQAAALQLILDRKLGSWHLPEGWICVAAGNRAEDRANIFEMSDPLKTRFLHIELDTSMRDFNKYWNSTQGDSRISSFLHFKPAYLHNQHSKSKEYTYACPRSWFFLNKLIKGEKDERRIKLFAISAIGEGVATEFSAFVKLFESFDIKEIMANPEKCDVPKEVSQLWSFVGAVGGYVNEHRTKENRTSAVKIAIRLEKQPEFAAYLMQMIMEKGNASSFNIEKIPEMDSFIKRIGKYI